MSLNLLNRWLLAAVVLFGLAAGAQWWEARQPQLALWTLGPVVEDEATAIFIRSAEGRLRVERGEDGWQLTEPIRTPADPRKVETFFKDWSKILEPDLRLLEVATDRDVALYGLAEGERIEVRVEGAQSRLFEVYIGKSTTGGSHYIARPGDPGVYRGRVAGGFRTKAELDYWRDKQLIPFPKDDFAEIRLTTLHGNQHYLRKKDERGASWEAVVPEGFEASNRELDAMARSLFNLRAKEIFDGDEAQAERPKAGLDRPRAEVVVRSLSGKERGLYFGGEGPGENTVYVEIEGDDRLFLAGASVLRMLEKDLESLRDRTALAFHRNDVLRIHLHQGAKTLTFVPVPPQGWGYEDGRSIPTKNQRKLDLALNTLGALEAKEVRRGKRLGLPASAPRVIIQTGSGTLELRIGKQEEDGTYPAERVGQKDIYIVRRVVIDRLAALFEDGAK